jgi:hypothetical protein
MWRSLAALLIFCSTGADATDYYIAASGGSDSYNGLSRTFTSGSNGPFATFSHALAVMASAGNRLLVESGTYAQGVTVWNYKGVNGNNIVVQGEPGYQRPVVSSVWVGGNNAYPASQYVTIRHLDVASSGAVGIGVSKASDIILDDNEVRNSYSTGIYLARTDGICERVTITNNIVHDNIQQNVNNAMGGGGWGEGIVSWDCPGTVISNNVSYLNWGEGIDVFDTIGIQTTTTVSHNIIYNNFSVGLYCDHCNGNTFDGNLIYNSSSARYRSGAPEIGISIADETANATNTNGNNVYKNNIVIGTSQGFRYGNYGNGGHGGYGLKNTTFVNNDVLDSTVNTIKIDSSTDAMSGNVFENNIFRSTTAMVSDSNPAGFTYRNNIWYGGGSTSRSGSGDKLVDPLFPSCGSKYLAPSYVIPAASPAQGAGFYYSGNTTDYFGFTRSNPPSIGAFE